MKKVTFVLLAGLVLLGAGTAARAVGTLAGTVISNQAYADFKDANANALARVYSNTVTTTVTQVAGVEVTPETSSRVVSPDEDVHILSEIWNQGNGTDTFDITYEVLPGGDFDPSGTLSLYSDSKTEGTRHVWDEGIDDQLLMTAPYSTTSDADVDDHVFIVFTVPDTAVDGDTVSVKLTAVSQLDGSVTDFGTYTVTVAAASLDTVKTYSPLNPRPGDDITYSFTFTNDGTVDATSVVLTDVIPDNTTYKAGSITLDTVTKTDEDGDDEADYNVTNPGEVTVNVGTISSGGGTATVTFKVTVDDGTTYNTGITNIADIAFMSGLNNLTGQSNTTLTYVAQISEVDLAATLTSQSADPGDEIVYPFTVTNDGNDTDTIDLTYTSSSGFTYEFWMDNDGNGIPGTNGDTLLTDTDGDGIIDTGDLTQDSTANLLAVATIPTGTSDGTVDSLTVTGTSTNDTDVSDQQSFTTTVTAPVLSAVKSVSPTGNQPPGTELTYTVEVTNSGTGTATNVVITDPVPQYTTYKTATIKTGSSLATLVTRTDDNDGDGGTFDGTNHRVVVGSGTSLSLGSGGKLFLQFTVTID